MRLDAPFLSDPELQRLTAAFDQAGYTILYVGGAVRNALLDQPISDIDMASDATPAQMLEIAKTNDLRAIPTGIQYGTVTLMAGDRPVEITTFRDDVDTDGRRAQVAFSDNFRDDAMRRDFTMNALYARPDGELLDPVDGLADLQVRNVRFIGQARQRIAEDHLRILRFFRFHAWYGDPTRGLDPDGLAACAETVALICDLSAERIGAEMRRLLAAPDPAPAVAAMRATGVLAQIMPGADDRALAPMVHLEGDLPADWIRRAACLGGASPSDRWRLSRAETRRLDLLRGLLETAEGPAEIAYRHGAEAARDACLIRAALFEIRVPDDLEQEIATGAAARFPVSAQDLMPSVEGAALGEALRRLESIWIASRFRARKAELLDQL